LRRQEVRLPAEQVKRWTVNKKAAECRRAQICSERAIWGGEFKQYMHTLEKQYPWFAPASFEE
jgi:hypothetical protein